MQFEEWMSTLATDADRIEISAIADEGIKFTRKAMKTGWNGCLRALCDELEAKILVTIHLGDTRAVMVHEFTYNRILARNVELENRVKELEEAARKADANTLEQLNRIQRSAAANAHAREEAATFPPHWAKVISQYPGPLRAFIVVIDDSAEKRLKRLNGDSIIGNSLSTNLEVMKHNPNIYSDLGYSLAQSFRKWKY